MNGHGWVDGWKLELKERNEWNEEAKVRLLENSTCWYTGLKKSIPEADWIPYPYPHSATPAKISPCQRPSKQNRMTTHSPA